MVTSGEDAKVRTRVVQSPNGGEPVEFEERLLEEPDSREKPFVHAYSWSTHKHPFGEKMDDVVVRVFVSFSFFVACWPSCKHARCMNT